MIIKTRVKQIQVFESLLLKSNQNTSNNLLIGNCICFQAIWHYIINVLHKDNVGINLIQILDQSAMTSWTEQQAAILIAERRIVRISSNRIGAWFLLRERDVVLHTKLLCIEICLLCHLLLEKFQMVMRNSKVYVSLTIATCIESCFYQVLLHRSAHLFSRILMEEQ